MNKRLASDIREAGYDAGYQGRTYENSYDPDSDEYQEWRSGYIDGEADWEKSDVGYED